jgi:hypothetical protein
VHTGDFRSAGNHQGALLEVNINNVSAFPDTYIHRILIFFICLQYDTDHVLVASLQFPVSIAVWMRSMSGDVGLLAALSMCVSFLFHLSEVVVE